MQTISVSQYLSLTNPRKVSKKNLARLKKGKDAMKSEDEHCVELVNHLDGHPQVRFFSHIRSESKTSNPALLGHFKKLGVRKGLPDYEILAENYHGQKIYVHIEMKTEDGRVSPEQKFFLDFVKECGKGVFATACFSFNEARTFFEECLSKKV